MPFSRPSLTDLRSQIDQDVQTGAAGDGAGVLRFAITKVLGMALAGLANGQYAYLDWIAKQAVPWTASGEWLEAWGGLIGVIRKPATAWTGLGQWSGAAGTLLPVGTTVAGSAGLAYVTTADATVSLAGSVQAPIAAVLAGSASTLQAGAAVFLSIGVPGINAGGSVVTSYGAGADAELDDAFRTRVLQKWAAPPQGGAGVDYVQWALAVPGVTRAWVAGSLAGAGTVSVFTMWDAAEAAYAGFPQGSNGVAAAEPRVAVGIAAATGDQLAVANAILPLQPVTALVYAVAPVAAPVNFVIQDLDSPSAAVQAAIRAALAQVFTDQASPAGTTFPITVPGVPNGSMYPSQFEAAIAAVPGVNRFTLVSPAARITAAAAAMPTLGSVSFI